MSCRWVSVHTGDRRPAQTHKKPKDLSGCDLLFLTTLYVIHLYSHVYYESMKRKVKPIYECRCNGRLQIKRFTRLSHTGLVVELEHLKIKTRLTNEKFASVKGECAFFMR